MRERDLVCLSVHDSIIVPLPEQNVAVQVLRAEYRRAAGVEPKLTMHSVSAEVQEVIPAA
jgi:hypothetical protein